MFTILPLRERNNSEKWDTNTLIIIIIITRKDNLDMRDSREYKQKQVMGEWEHIEALLDIISANIS